MYPELGLTYGQLGIDDHTHVPPGNYLHISSITWWVMEWYYMWWAPLLSDSFHASPNRLFLLFLISFSLTVTSQVNWGFTYCMTPACNVLTLYTLYVVYLCIVFNVTKEIHSSCLNIGVVWSVCPLTSFLFLCCFNTDLFESEHIHIGKKGTNKLFLSLYYFITGSCGKYLFNICHSISPQIIQSGQILKAA